MTATTWDTGGSVTLRDILRAVAPQYVAKTVARAANLSHRTIEDWLQGRTCPSFDLVMHIAERDARVCAELRRALDRLDAKRAIIDAEIARLQATRPAVARIALDRACRVGAGTGQAVPRPARSAVAVTR